MPVVVQKAAKLPSFIDIAPPPALRREHAIGQRHLSRFSRAYMRVSRSIYDPATLRRLRAALDEVVAGERTIEEAVNVVDWFNPNDPLAAKQWELLGVALELAYSEIVEDAGQGETNAQGWPIRFQVTKAVRPLLVPINPFSIAWIRLKAGSLVREISDQQQNLLREILVESFEEGQSSAAILEEIERVVGLLSRERQAVSRRRELLIEKGATNAVANKRTDRYAKQLLRKRARRIARTETIDAYSQGLDDSWELAKEEGFIEGTTMEEWVELTDSPRTCKICRGLGGQRVPVGEPFVSDIIGEVRRPPAHPHCRCTKILVFIDDVDVDESLANADRDAIDARATLAGG